MGAKAAAINSKLGDFDICGRNCSTMGTNILNLPTILCEVVPSADPNERSLKKSYVYAHGQVLAQQDYMQNPTGRYYYLADRLGSVRQVLDNAGNVVNAYTYKPFGEDFTNACIETVENPFKFTGQYFDGEINQYYLRARMYDPQLMRFSTRDPVKGYFDDPLSLHRYLYCWNDSVNHIDLKGKVPLMAVKIVVGGLVSGVSNAVSAEGGAEDKLKAFAVGFVIGSISALAGDAGRLVGFFAGFAGAIGNNMFMSYLNGEDQTAQMARMCGSGLGLLAGAFGVLIGDKTGNLSGIIMDLSGTIVGNHLGDAAGAAVKYGSGLMQSTVNAWDEEMDN